MVHTCLLLCSLGWYDNLAIIQGQVEHLRVQFELNRDTIGGQEPKAYASKMAVFRTESTLKAQSITHQHYDPHCVVDEYQ